MAEVICGEEAEKAKRGSTSVTNFWLPCILRTGLIQFQMPRMNSKEKVQLQSRVQDIGDGLVEVGMEIIPDSKCK